MRWYNKDRTKMLDLDTINGYVYIPAKEYIEQNPTEDNVDDFKTNGDRLELIIGGSVYVFRGDTAKEIFSLLNTNKELIKG
jgi:hypothetical protein